MVIIPAVTNSNQMLNIYAASEHFFNTGIGFHGIVPCVAILSSAVPVASSVSGFTYPAICQAALFNAG